MKKASWGMVCVCLWVAGAAGNASAQANVNESLETNYIYVDAVNGSDSNPGTQAQPLQTIGAAVNLATAVVQTTGSLITVNPGTYRETLNFINAPQNNLPITVQAATNGTVTISGADVYTGWQAYGGNPNIYTNTWSYDWGFCPAELGDGAPYQTPLMLRREMVFVNGLPMTQVLSLSDMVYPDMFYVDETNGVIYVWPPSGTDMSTATVEVATRDPLVLVMGWDSLVFRGITFQYANSCHNNRAVWVEANSNNILFDTDTFQWNNAKGLNFTNPFTDVTVQNSYGLHNGQTGFTDFQGLNVVYSNVTAEYNNWRGAEGSYYSWAMGGYYFEQDHNDTVTNLTALYQPSNGIHWDTDNINSTATNVLTAGNMLNGIFYEKDLGPLTLTNSTIADNMPNPQISQLAGGGILFRNSEYITLTNNNIFGNGNAQMYVTGQPGGIQVTDWASGITYNLVSSYLTFQQNVMESTTATPYVFDDPFLNGTDWTTFYTTLSSTQNTWWNGANSIAFGEPTPVPFSYNDFGTWQSTTGQDLNSVFLAPNPDPAQNFTLPAPDYPDYWLAVDNSTLQVAADGTAIFNVSTIPVGSFSGNVSLFLDGVSEVPGLSGSLNTNSISVPGTATLSLSSLPTIAPGYYPLTVVSNQGDATKVVQFNVIIPTSSLRIVPATLNFPATQVNYSSAPQTATATNYGTTPITITSIIQPPQFTESDNCNGLIPAGGSCTLTIIFVPNAATSFSDQLSISDSDPTSPQILTLNGTGLPAPLVSLSSYALTYGLVPLGQNSVMTSVLTNTGAGVLNISSVAVSGTNASDYTQANDCGSTVQPGATCTFTVTFTPSAVNQRTATVTITDNAGAGTTQTITLSGNGSQPSVQLPASLAFGNQVLGSPVSNNITLTNGGNGTLNITSLAISGTNAGDFTQTNTCGTQVAAYASCTITVTYAPTVLGAESASLLVTDDAPNSPQVVAISGTGTQAALSFTPDPLGFGNQTVNTTSNGQVITVTNSGTATVTISSVSLGGTNASNFTIAQTCGQLNLAPGVSCSVTLKFTPTSMGAYSATLLVASNAPGSPASIPLTGTGIEAIASLSPTSLAFGDQLLQTTSAGQNVTLTNTGNTALTITAIAVKGTYQNWFATTNTCGTSVAAGASCTITTTFTPLADGAAAPSINLTDNGTGSPQTVALSGTGVSPTVTLAPTILSFGNTNVGSSATAQTATVTNTGTGTLTITSIGVTGTNAGDFTETNTCGTSLGVNASCTVTVDFTPTATGSRTADITFTDNATNSPQNLTVKGTGIQATVSLTPSSVSFGNQNVGMKSTGTIVTLTNTGNETLTISSIGFTGTNAADFTDTKTCLATLGAGKTCTVTVYFKPSIVGAESGDLTFTTNAPDSPENVGLTGTGIQPNVDPTPSSLSFGNQLVKTSSAPQISTISNVGTAPLNFTSIKITGTDANWYSETNTCGTSLPVGGSCVVTVIFTPLANGTATPTVTITDNANPPTQTITLSGTGISPTVTLTPKTLSLGNAIVGTSSKPLTATLTNSGTDTLTLSSIVVTGTNPGDFAETNTCGTSLGIGASCTITATFTPTATGARTANVTFTDNATNSPQNLTLKGTGTDPTVSLTPSSLTFPNENVGAKSAGMTVTLKNTGNATLTIDSITVGGADAGDFSDTTKCGTTLAAGKSCTVTAFFKPTATGTRTGTVIFTTNAPGSPATVTLTGTGTQPEVTLTPTTVSFGTVPINTTSAPMVVTLQNTGTGSLTINSTTFSGTNKGWFAQTNTCGKTVAAGASCTYSITVTPKARTTGTGTMNVNDTAPSSPQTVSLTATGS